MAPDFKSYLATQVVAEKQTVSYRNVSRALKVHVNAAKCMLYEFHKQENKKRPGSIYATYLIAGTKGQQGTQRSKNGNLHRDDEDEPMPSSPPPFTSSMLEPSQQSDQEETQQMNVPVKTISLVREELLEDTRQQYENITSIHIYSLSPGRLQDLVALTDIGRDLFANNFLKEDPLVHNKTFGVIQNPGVRRRKGKRPIIPDVPTAKFQPVKNGKEEAIDSKATKFAIAKEDSKPSSRDSTPGPPTKPILASSKQPSLKRDSSSLFKAFAKQSAKPKLEKKDTDASASGADDLSMADADEEGESEDEALFLDTNTKKGGSSSTSRKRSHNEVKKERDDKAAKLRRMMDSDDEEDEEEPEPAVPNVEDATGIKNAPPSALPDATGEADADPDQKGEGLEWSESDSEKPSATAGAATKEAPKRRRGKRKVMKKRTMKDEEGFLVTKEEPVWESFSEDEPEPVAKTKEKSKNVLGASGTGKSQPAGGSQTLKSSGAAAAGKGETNKKKGDIMSFFGKR